MNNIEEKRNKLNVELIGLLYTLDMIDGLKEEYKNYETGALKEEDFLDDQIKLASAARTRLINLFRD